MTTENKPIRVSFFVDGFNLYHSIREAERGGASLKWLDLPSLCKFFLYLVDTKAVTEEIHYFTAYAEHLHRDEPDKIERHKAFVRALTATRVIAHTGTFRRRSVENRVVYEEKETDVAIACEVLAHAVKDFLDVAIIVSGDSDFVPLVNTFKDLFPEKKILFAFPYGRTSKQLRKLCPESFSISKDTYARHQFPEQVKLPSGKYVNKPDSWK